MAPDELGVSHQLQRHPHRRTDANGYHRLVDVPGSESESSEWDYVPDYDEDGYND